GGPPGGRTGRLGCRLGMVTEAPRGALGAPWWSRLNGGVRRRAASRPPAIGHTRPARRLTMPTTIQSSPEAVRALEDATAEFVRLRPRLHGIAHRILGCDADAEDIVQDAWIRWQTCDRTQVGNATAFLVTMT